MTSTAPLVLLVEDEPPMRRFLRTTLEHHGYRLVEATTVREGITAAASHRPEIILLDLGLPDGDGRELIARVREWSAVPIVVLSARGREGDKVGALDAGADDYITKPFGVNELFARMRVAMRHARATDGADAEPVIEIGELRIDFERREVTRSGEPVHLTPIEYRLLSFLARHAGKVLTHRQILREVWGASSTVHSHYVRVFMAQLRRKIERDPARPSLLFTEPGVGYRMKAE